MAQLSGRITGLNAGGSDGWEILYRARKLTAQGVQVVDLTIGDHDQRTDDLILDAMYESARGGHTGYAAIPGTRELRTAIADRVQARTGVPTTYRNVLVTAGGQAALFAALMATLDPGDAAIYIDPYYATYSGTIRSVSGTPVPVAARPQAGFQPQRTDLDATGPAKALLINTPNNPTGVIYTRETLTGICDFTTHRDMWLISDEVYETQVWDGEHLSPRALPGMADRCLVVGSLSKSHRMTGARLGWVIGPGQAIGAMADLAVNTTYGVPGFIQDAATRALIDGAGIEAEVARTYRDRRVAALSAIDGVNCLRPVPSSGAMYLMLDIRTSGRSGIDFAQDLLDSRSIAVMPGESFGKAAAGHIRIALTRPTKELVPALHAIADFAGGS